MQYEDSTGCLWTEEQDADGYVYYVNTNTMVSRISHTPGSVVKIFFSFKRYTSVRHGSYALQIRPLYTPGVLKEPTLKPCTPHPFSPCFRCYTFTWTATMIV